MSRTWHDNRFRAGAAGAAGELKRKPERRRERRDNEHARLGMAAAGKVAAATAGGR
jgi:hypothetical protein